MGGPSGAGTAFTVLARAKTQSVSIKALKFIVDVRAGLICCDTCLQGLL